MDALIDQPRTPTIADIEALPSNVKGEILDGVLHPITRPRATYQAVTSPIGGK